VSLCESCHALQRLETGHILSLLLSLMLLTSLFGYWACGCRWGFSIRALLLNISCLCILEWMKCFSFYALQTNMKASGRKTTNMSPTGCSGGWIFAGWFCLSWPSFDLSWPVLENTVNHDGVDCLIPNFKFRTKIAVVSVKSWLVFFATLNCKNRL